MSALETGNLMCLYLAVDMQRGITIDMSYTRVLLGYWGAWRSVSVSQWTGITQARD